jgi:hypothetical protein
MTPQEAIESAVSMLQAGPAALPEGAIREAIREALEVAALAQRQAKLDDDHQAARNAVNKAAKALQNALGLVHRLEPWVETEEGPTCLHSLLPIDSPEGFETALSELAKWGEVETSWTIQEGRWAGHTAILANPPRKRTRPTIPPAVIVLHMRAVSMLKAAEIDPATGTGASVAKLGALLCAAAGLRLKGGESTKAARMARSPRELLAHAGIDYSKVQPQSLPNLDS